MELELFKIRLFDHLAFEVLYNERNASNYKWVSRSYGIDQSTDWGSIPEGVVKVHENSNFIVARYNDYNETAMVDVTDGSVFFYYGNPGFPKDQYWYQDDNEFDLLVEETGTFHPSALG